MCVLCCAVCPCRTCIERTDRGSLNGDSLIDLVGLVLDNAAIGVSDNGGGGGCDQRGGVGGLGLGM